MQQKGNRIWREPSKEQLLPVGKYENERKRLDKERNKEYNELVKQKVQMERKNDFLGLSGFASVS